MREAMDKAIQEKISLKVQADERKESANSLSVENINVKKQLQQTIDENKQLAHQLKQ